MTEDTSDIAAPFPPSWIDRLIQWIEGLPGPIWLFYLLAVLATALVINVVLWVDGSVPVWAYGSIPGIFPPFVFYFLALYHYLTRVGSRSLQAFRPILEMDEAEIARTDYELASLPRWLGWIAPLLALITTPPYFTGDRLAFGSLVPHTVLPVIVAVAGAVFFGATIFGVLFRSFRQLRMVHELHIQATNINLLKLGPAHAFSRLTARTAIGVVLITVLGYIYDPSAISSSFILVAYLFFAALGVVIFVVPVIGMRERLEQEKTQALGEATDMLIMTTGLLESKIRDHDFADLRGIETAIKALTRKREQIDKISTYPWDTQTLRGFASTLLLPIFLWLVTRVLARFF
jgi:hypothetical protein